jgi:regulator of nucleoside diphosphate kinase
VSDTLALLGAAERERLGRFVEAWESRLALDGKHVATLRARLQAATTMSDGATPANVVTLHSQVRVRDIETGREFVWTVVLPPDEEILKTARSPSSWSGAALLGRRQGDELDWPSRHGSRRVRIEAVLYQPHAVSGSAVREAKRASRARREVRTGRAQSSGGSRANGREATGNSPISWDSARARPLPAA